MHTIGPASVEDAQAMLEIQRRAFAEEGRRVGRVEDGREIPPLAETLDSIIEHIERQTALVARDGGRIVGAVRGVVTGKVCVIRALVVDLDCQGRGIGSSLLKALERALPEVGRFDLTTNAVMENNVPFYERHGYHVTEVTRYAGAISLAQMTKDAATSAVTRTNAVKFREITAADVPALFHVRPRTRENALTLEELQSLGINPQSVTESLVKSTKGWVCDDAGRVVAFAMAERATGELLVIAVLPGYEGRGIGGRLMTLAEEWLAASGCKRAWLTTDPDTSLRAYGFYRKRGWTDWKIERGMRWMEFRLPQ